MPKPSLTKRADGRYRVKYQGKQFYGATQKEAYAKRDEYRRMLEAGIKAEADGLCVQTYALRWVKTYKAHLTPAAYNAHVRILNRFCAHKGIGRRPLKDIDTIDIQDFYNQADGMSHSYICDMRDTIRGLFKFAVADRVIQYDPTIKARLPKGSKGTHRVITDHERELIHRTVHKIRPAVMVMLYAGLRRGEVLALDIDRDVDFEAKTITVREAVRFAGQQAAILVDPKTEAGRRTVPLLDILAEELQGLHGLILHGETGQHMTHSAWRAAWSSYITTMETLDNGCHKRWYGRTKQHKKLLADGHELPPWRSITLRAHDLRHSYCTMLYDADVDVKTAQAWMGHADQEVTMGIYTHLTAEREKKASKALENAAKKLAGVQIGVQVTPSSLQNVDP